MIEHAIRVASEAAAADIPGLIAEWTRQHPALVRPDAGEELADGTRAVTPRSRGEA
jgi:hypothetical protein